MDIMELEQVVKNIDRRLSLLEQILPTLATKEDLKAFPTKDDPKGFATKDDLKGFATKDDLKGFATKDDLKGFATKDDLKGFATKDDLKGFPTQDDPKGFATKNDVAAAVTELRAEMRREGEHTRQHFNAVAERLEGHVRLIAEGHIGLQQKLEETNRRFDTAIAGLDRRVTRLEAR